MKFFLSIMLTLTVSLHAQKETKKKKELANENSENFVALSKAEAAELQKKVDFQRGLYINISRFIEKEYVKKAKEVNIPKLEKELLRAETILRKAKREATIKRAKEEILKIKAKIEVEKMWDLYNKAYFKQYNSYQKKDIDTYMKMSNLIEKIHKRHLELTSLPFPNPEGKFYEKYEKEIKKREAELSKNK